MFYRFEFEPPVSDWNGKMVFKAICKAESQKDALRQLPAHWRKQAVLKASGVKYREVEK